MKNFRLSIITLVMVLSVGSSLFVCKIERVTMSQYGIQLEYTTGTGYWLEY